MIARQRIPLSTDRYWREIIRPTDMAYRLPADLTGATAQIFVRGKRIYDRKTLGTDTGEIVNNGSYFSVIAQLFPGIYCVEGEYTKNGETVPFISAELRITDLYSQLIVLPQGQTEPEPSLTTSPSISLGYGSFIETGYAVRISRSIRIPFGYGSFIEAGNVASIGLNENLASGTFLETGYSATFALGAPSLSAEVIQFFDRLITMPSSSRQTAYATLIDGLVSDGVWSKLDCLFIFAAGDRATALTNLVQDPHLGFLDTATGVPTFTADVGWTALGLAGNLDVNSNFNPSTSGGNYTQNDAMVCAWQIGTTQENRALIDDTTADSKIELFEKWSDGHTYWGINGNGTEVSSTAPSNIAGFWLMQRTGASACELHLNDTSIGTSTNASAALVNASIIARPNANTVACLVIGASLSSGQQTSIFTSIQTYLTAVGAI